MAQRVIFLDRDGTINVDDGYVHMADNWHFTHEAPKALKRLAEAGYKLVVVTNQGGVAQGLYTEEEMHELHRHMETELERHGVRLNAIQYCPHSREESTCECRKPNIGMARQAEAVIGPIDYAASWMIGDKITDVGFGKKAGTQTALIRSQYWTPADVPDAPDMIVDSLWDFAQQVGREA